MQTIGWDLAFGEFTLFDHYYFSHLQTLITAHGARVIPISSWPPPESVDILVFNYPERPFSEAVRPHLEERIRAGLHALFLAYYQNEDQVADILNGFLKPYGCRINHDVVLDATHCYRGDPYWVCTHQVTCYNEGVQSVLMPCSASLHLMDPGWVPVIRAEATARGEPGSDYPTLVLAADYHLGQGCMTVFGTCVFWDNYSLDLYDNRRFVLNLLGLARADENGT